MACAFISAVCASNLHCFVALRPPLFLPAHIQPLSPPQGREKQRMKSHPAGFTLQIRMSCSCVFTPLHPASAAAGSRSGRLRRHAPVSDPEVPATRHRPGAHPVVLRAHLSMSIRQWNHSTSVGSTGTAERKFASLWQQSSASIRGSERLMLCTVPAMHVSMCELRLLQRACLLGSTSSRTSSCSRTARLCMHT